MYNQFKNIHKNQSNNNNNGQLYQGTMANVSQYSGMSNGSMYNDYGNGNGNGNSNSNNGNDDDDSYDHSGNDNGNLNSNVIVNNTNTNRNMDGRYQSHEHQYALQIICKIVERNYSRHFLKRLMFNFIQVLRKSQVKAVIASDGGDRYRGGQGRESREGRKKVDNIDWPFKYLYMKSRRNSEEQQLFQFVNLCATMIQSKFKAYLTHKRHAQAFKKAKRSKQLLESFIKRWKIYRTYNCEKIVQIRRKVSEIQREIDEEEEKFNNRDAKKLKGLYKYLEIYTKMFKDTFWLLMETGMWTLEKNMKVKVKGKGMNKVGNQKQLKTIQYQYANNPSNYTQKVQPIKPSQARRPNPSQQNQSKKQNLDNNMNININSNTNQFIGITVNNNSSMMSQSYPYSQFQDRPIKAAGQYKFNQLENSTRVGSGKQSGEYEDGSGITNNNNGRNARNAKNGNDDENQEQRQQKNKQRIRKAQELQKRKKYDPRKAIQEEKQRKKQKQINQNKVLQGQPSNLSNVNAASVSNMSNVSTVNNVKKKDLKQDKDKNKDRQQPKNKDRNKDKDKTSQNILKKQRTSSIGNQQQYEQQQQQQQQKPKRTIKVSKKQQNLKKQAQQIQSHNTHKQVLKKVSSKVDCWVNKKQAEPDWVKEYKNRILQNQNMHTHTQSQIITHVQVRQEGQGQVQERDIVNLRNSLQKFNKIQQPHIRRLKIDQSQPIIQIQRQRQRQKDKEIKITDYRRIRLNSQQRVDIKNNQSWQSKEQQIQNLKQKQNQYVGMRKNSTHNLQEQVRVMLEKKNNLKKKQVHRPIQQLQQTYSRHYGDRFQNLMPRLSLLAVARNQERHTRIPVLSDQSQQFNLWFEQLYHSTQYWKTATQYDKVFKSFILS